MIKILPALLVVALLLAGCQPGADEVQDEQHSDRRADVSYVSYGDEISEDEPALAVADVASDAAAFHGSPVRVEGEIVQVCRQQGCWLSLDNPMGEPLRVHVAKDDAGEYLWTVPTDLGRHMAIVEGTIFTDTLSVDDRRHYAEDGGATQEEIDAITEDRPSAYITATGILVEQTALATSPAESDSPAAQDAGETHSD